MSPEEILNLPANILSQSQRESYFEQGYLLVEGLIDGDQLDTLRAVMSDFEARGGKPDECPEDFEFEVLPETGKRQLRQVLRSADYYPELWEYASTNPMIDLVADVVGPNVKYLQSNVAFKVPGGRGFPWHQDFAFVPSSNLSPLMAFTFLEDVVPEMGPTKVIPGSHRHDPYDHYDEDGNWLGVIGEHDLERAPTEDAVEVCGPAGSIFMASCLLVHSAERNMDSRARPLVINGYMSADAYCYVESPYQSRYNWQIVRGEPAAYIDSDGPRMKLPPVWEHYEGVRIDGLEHNF